jgi:hypothetical protein
VRSTRAGKGGSHEVAVRLKADAKTRNLILFPRPAAS